MTSRRVFGVTLAGAAILAAAMVVASLLGSRGGTAEPPSPVAGAAKPEPAAERDALLRGVPQAGIALGSPEAPVTVVEYADLQCPWCAAWARDAFPTIVDRYVRTGRVRMVFRGPAFLGPDSHKALRAALAAGQEDRLWDVVHGLYTSQGAENSGWVSEGLLRSLGARAGIDADHMLARSYSPGVERELAAAAAERAGVPGTPFFEAGPTGGRLEPLRIGSLDAATFTAELDRLLSS